MILQAFQPRGRSTSGFQQVPRLLHADSQEMAGGIGPRRMAHRHVEAPRELGDSRREEPGPRGDVLDRPLEMARVPPLVLVAQRPDYPAPGDVPSLRDRACRTPIARRVIQRHIVLALLSESRCQTLEFASGPPDRASAMRRRNQPEPGPNPTGHDTEIVDAIGRRIPDRLLREPSESPEVFAKRGGETDRRPPTDSRHRSCPAPVSRLSMSLQHRSRRDFPGARSVPPRPQRFLQDALVLALFLRADTP